MEEERSNRHCIMNLPAEMRKLIYNNLPQKEVLNTRTVCKQWAEEVLEFFEFSTEKMEKVRELKIKECRVWFFYTPPPISPSRTSLFKYPKFIRQLYIDTSRLSEFNFQNLMQECSQYLEELTIRLKDFSEQQLWEGEVKADLIASYPLSLGSEINFQNLRKLHVSEGRPYSDALLSGLENDIFLRLLRNPSITKLTSLTIGWDMYYSSYREEVENNVALKLSGAFISLIARQWKTLQTLNIVDCFDLFKNAEETPLSILETIDTTLWEKVDSLKKIYLKAREFEDEIPEEVHTLNTWSDCLRNQKRLEEISLSYTIRYPLFLQVIDANVATLSDVQVDLSFQDHSETPLDMSIFRNCNKLQKLSLSLDFDKYCSTNPLQDIVNLRELPKSIKEVRLDSFGISLEDLDAFFSDSKEFKSLEGFTLLGHERSEKPKVNGSILEKVLNFPGILRFEISSTLGFATSPGERTKLKAVFRRFNEKYDHDKLLRNKSLVVIRDSIDKPFRSLPCVDI